MSGYDIWRMPAFLLWLVGSLESTYRCNSAEGRKWGWCYWRHAPAMWRKERATWETEEEYRWVSDLWGKGKGVDGTVTTYNILTLSDDKTKPIGKNVTLLYTKTKYCGNKMGFWIGHFGMGMLDIGLPCEGLWIWSSFSVMIHSIYIKVTLYYLLWYGHSTLNKGSSLLADIRNLMLLQTQNYGAQNKKIMKYYLIFRK